LTRRAGLFAARGILLEAEQKRAALAALLNSGFNKRGNKFDRWVSVFGVFGFGLRWS